MGCTSAFPTLPAASVTRSPRTGCTLTQIYGIGDIGAVTIISIVGDVRRFPTRGHFARVQQPPHR
jgi:transposase